MIPGEKMILDLFLLVCKALSFFFRAVALARCSG